MRTTIDFSAPTPVYEQLAEILRQKIRLGELPANRQVPSQKELVQQYRVARGTAARAVKILQAEGWARRVPGKGVFVAAGPPAPVSRAEGCFTLE